MGKTILFECCSCYTHLNHAINWIEKKEKCPNCGQEDPYTIELPGLTLT